MPHKQTTPSPPKISRLPAPSYATVQERMARGREQRKTTRRSAHAEWSPAAGRDLLGLLAASNVGRVEELVPIRHSRMLVSPFTFFRGTPAVMAYDLAHTPSSEIVVQLCGDCHISNFGMFASPERALVFDLNDFDETLPGPFEWDVKRTAASIVVAARNAEIDEDDAHAAVALAMQVYRQKMHDFAARGALGLWYSRTEADVFLGMVDKKHRKTTATQLTRVQERDRMRAFAKLTEEVDGERRIVHDPPLLYRLDKMEEATRAWLIDLFKAYHASLEESRRRLLSRYRLVDVALKVVGVGSVGTRCFISYWEGNGEGDPLFLQIKQANPSLLEPYLGCSEYEQPGQRVVVGQRLMQATSDIFLGYTRSGGQDYFVRQLYDMKASADLATIPAPYLVRYAALCGAVLARAHARSGDPAVIAGYLGKSDAFDKALVEFALRYADQNEADYQIFKEAVAAGKLKTQNEQAPPAITKKATEKRTSGRNTGRTQVHGDRANGKRVTGDRRGGITK